jgi:hypothetical protein
MLKELRLAGISSIAAANAWLPGFIAAYNTRFGRDPANAKSLPWLEQGTCIGRCVVLGR